MYIKKPMRIEILILGITGLIIFNLYTDGKYLNMAMKWTKYYKMIGGSVITDEIPIFETLKNKTR